jgi:hypothetical protein
MFELFSDIYFVVYKLYYVDQNDNLDIRVSLKNWDKGSNKVISLSSLNCEEPCPSAAAPDKMMVAAFGELGWMGSSPQNPGTQQPVMLYYPPCPTGSQPHLWSRAGESHLFPRQSCPKKQQNMDAT